MYEFQLSGKLPYHVELRTFSLKKEKPVSLKYPALVFVMANDLFIKLAGEEEKMISEGQFFLLPRGIVCELTSPGNTETIILQIPNISALYVFFISKSFYLEPDRVRLFYPLPIERHMLRTVEGLKLYMKGGIIDPVLAGLKTLELFYNLKNSYSKDILETFFSPVCTKECSFASFVLSNHANVKTAEELAQLSNYSFSGFNKQFHKVFGISSYKWMLQQKIDKIYKEIYYETSKPIKLIAEEFGFANISNLGDFCRKHLGASPAAIRNRKK